MKRLTLLLLCLLLFTCWSLSAQETADFTFSHVGQGQGIHSQRIYSIQQTQDGAVWWSTKSDVERFNGVSIQHYLLGEQSVYSDFAGKSIMLRTYTDQRDQEHPKTRLIAFENKGRIFVYDEVNDCFTLVTDLTKLMKKTVSLNDVLMTSEGLWLAMNEGIFFLHDGKLTTVTAGVHTSYIIQTARSLLFCTRQGVLEYKDKAAIPQGTTHMPTLVANDVESGFYDSIYNKVWLGGYSGGVHVLSFNEKGQLTASDAIVSDIDIVHNPVRSISPYNEYTMLLGIDGMGVYKVNRRPSAAGSYMGQPLFNANEGKHGVLHGNGIYSVLCDVWGNILIGSYSGGIDIARPVGTTIAIYQHTHNNQQTLLNDHVNCVEQIQDDLLMGTDDGVSILNTMTQQWTHTSRGCVVLDLCKTPQGTILAATYGKGVMELTADGRSRLRYSKASGALDDDHVYRLFYDRRGDLWMGCLDGSLVQQTASGNHYYPIHYVKDILQLPDGQLAVATTYGIHLVNPVTHKVKMLRYAPEGEHDVNAYVHTLYLNKGKELWIGTDGGGIYIYHLGSQECKHLTVKNGLPTNVVNSISKDVLGRIMIATERGLAFVDPLHADRIVGVNYCYGVDREYSSRAVVNLRNGHIMLGSTTGAVVIDPNHVQEINYTARITLRRVNCGDDADEDFVPRSHKMLANRDLYLNYDQRTFELFFESINLRNQSDIVYQYKVGNEEWSTPTDQQHISFTKMEPGKHQLLLRSVSKTCGAVLDEVLLTIHIRQPWWNSWWMWLVYVCLVLLAFYGAWRIYQLHTKYMRLVLSNPGISGSVVTDASFGSEANDEAEEKNHESQAFIEKVTSLVVEHLSDTDFTIDRLCREMAMSRTLFYVKLKSFTGNSPQDFIRIIRLERAASLLRSGRNVTDVAALTGFDNPKYFSTVFKKYFGVSPSKYQ